MRTIPTSIAWLTACAVCVLSGCASAASPAQEPATVAVPVKGAPPAPVEEDPPAAEAPCVLSERDLSTPVELRFFPTSRAIAELRDGPSVKLVLPAGTKSAPARLGLTKNGVAFFTPYDEQELPIRPRGPLALRGIVHPLPHRSVTWLASHGSTVRVRYELGEDLEPQSLEDDVACDALGLNPAFDVAEIAGGSCEPGDQHVALGEPVPFSTQPKAAPSVTVKLKFTANPFVAILRARGDWSEVCLPTSDDYLVGWLPNEALSTSPVDLVGRGLGLSGVGVGGGRGASHHNWVSCKTELVLYAELDGRRDEVGRIAPGTRFDKRQERDNYAVVDFWDPWIWPLNDSVFLVNREALADCST